MIFDNSNGGASYYVAHRQAADLALVSDGVAHIRSHQQGALVVVSGDGDFYDLLRFAQGSGCEAVLAVPLTPRLRLRPRRVLDLAGQVRVGWLIWLLFSVLCRLAQRWCCGRRDACGVRLHGWAPSDQLPRWKTDVLLYPYAPSLGQ